MSNLEKFTEAFQLVSKYEEYKLIRMWGVSIIAIGIARFFLSWIFNFLFMLVSRPDSVTIALTIAIFRSTIWFVLVVTLALVLGYTYLSVKKTVIKDNELTSSRFLYFGMALAVLFLFTFIINFRTFLFIPGNSNVEYWEEAIGVFLSYFILRKSIHSSNFKELLYSGFILFGVSILEFVWRIVFVLFFYSSPLAVPIDVLAYLAIGIIFMVPYIISGLISIKKASLILEKRPPIYEIPIG